MGENLEEGGVGSPPPPITVPTYVIKMLGKKGMLRARGLVSCARDLGPGVADTAICGQ